MENILGLAGLAAASFLAGIINSLAGGGSLLSFPALIAYGQPALLANATKTAAVWPGTVSSAFAYRREFPEDRQLVLSLVLSSIAGGLLGAAILVKTPPDLFMKLTPFLVVFGTSLFAARSWFAKLAAWTMAHPGKRSPATRVLGALFQLFVATYAGYFGAGAGMLMLGSFGLLGVTDIHRMNALKTVLASIMNGIALIYFIFSGLIVWPLAVLMGAAAMAGGYVGASTARRMNQRVVQRLIVILGFTASAWLFCKAY